MEVGAVKQAFNNEVIHLKKKLNQAKIHVIHKLTRKAKTLTGKKAPEHLKEKLKRKAEYAVNEVLIIKKIKSKDIAKFMITHTGEVKDYLNRPKVDNDKACARLVLHKSLEDKYNFFRNRFGNVPIKDLFMSRQERIKIKKESREQQKNKNKSKKGKGVNKAGDWDVEDVKMGDEGDNVSQNEIDSDGKATNDDIKHSEAEINEGSDDEYGSEVEDQEIADISQNEIDSDGKATHDDSEHSEAEINEGSDIENESEVEHQDISENNGDENHNSQSDEDISEDEVENDNNDNDSHENDDDQAEVGKYLKLSPVKELKKSVKKVKLQNIAIIDEPKIDNFKPQKKQIDRKLKEKKQTHKKVKDNKNKNLKEKLQNRKFNKDEEDGQVEGRKVVDPFFITASGENYLSLAEPRQPDEVKENHKRGNRKERRAALFGHEVNIRPKRDNFRQNNFRSNKFDVQNDDKRPAGFRSNNDRFNKGPSFGDRNSKFNDRNTKFDDRKKVNDVNLKYINRSLNNDKNEKLHPSWEAKKKLKSAMSLLPAQGKKTVFNDS